MKKRLFYGVAAVALSASTSAVNVGTPAVVYAAESTENTISPIELSEDAYTALYLMFDEKYYAETYPDVVSVLGTSKAALFAHYLLHGIYESRDASGDFNLDAYVAANPDLVLAFNSDNTSINVSNFILHYCNYGINENRLSTLAEATTAGVTVTSATNPQVTVATPKKTVTAVAGGGSSSGSSSSSSSSSSSGSSNASSADDITNESENTKTTVADDSEKSSVSNDTAETHVHDPRMGYIQTAEQVPHTRTIEVVVVDYDENGNETGNHLETVEETYYTTSYGLEETGVYYCNICGEELGTYEQLIASGYDL